ncbi:hypothetical protein [Scytonema millei]|uniref:Uncharacterized protein n=1 Tax=Scytonema millei VB511283 TaxID=1245923 RepID=A0A9X5I6W3_9CYAN|nr:hypothetical protein [Scytonema millei]NHC37531.1 hypothetical protein [Scytonema millei VB511283]
MGEFNCDRGFGDVFLFGESRENLATIINRDRIEPPGSCQGGFIIDGIYVCRGAQLCAPTNRIFYLITWRSN